MNVFLSLFFSVIILFSNVGIQRDTHFCGGIAVFSEFNFGGDELSCGMKLGENNSCSNSFHFISKKACCKNNIVKLNVDDNYNKGQLFHFIGTTFPTQIIEYFIPLKIQLSSNYITYLSVYLLKDVPIWNQSFLI